MENPEIYTGREAVRYLCDIFREIDPERTFRVVLEGADGGTESMEVTAKVGIAGLWEEHRRQLGRLEGLKERTGSVYLYGDEQSDFFMVLNFEGKTMLFHLGGAEVRRAGFARSILKVGSENWRKASAVDIYLKDLYIGEDALGYFTGELLGKIADGMDAAFLGKWISTLGLDRNVEREEAEKGVLEKYLEDTGKETVKTMVVGAGITTLEFVPGDAGKDRLHLLETEQKANKTAVEFGDMIIESHTAGKEIGARLKDSTYVYFLGTPFSAPANLLIIRHAGGEDSRNTA